MLVKLITVENKYIAFFTWDCFTVWQISFRPVKDVILLGTLSEDDSVLRFGFPLQQRVEEFLVIFQTPDIQNGEKQIIKSTVKMQKV